MMTDNFNIPDPEEFWPEAQAVLDGHYRKKRRKRALIWLFLLALLSGGGLWIYNNTSGNETSRTAEAEYGIPQTEVKDEEVMTVPKERTPSGDQKTSYPASPTSEEKDVEDNITAGSVEKQTSPLSRAGRNKAGFEKAQLKVDSRIIDQVEAVNKDNSQITGTYPEMILPMSLMQSSIVTFSLEEAEVLKGPDGEKRVSIKEKEKAMSLLHVYGGLAQVNHTVINPGNSLYTNRREKEESPAILPLSGLQWVRESRVWGTRIGVEMAVLGEKTGYSPWLFGDYTSTTGIWNPTTVTVTDTDSAYIYGMLFYNVSNRTVNDSLYTLITDTLQGFIYDNAVADANGINRKYILQLPVEVTYKLTGSRLSLSAIVGIVPGLNVRSKGRYLTRDERGLYYYNESSSRQFTLGAGAGLECSYQVGELLRLSFSARYRHQLLHYREENGADLLYRSIGLQGGLMFMLR